MSKDDGVEEDGGHGKADGEEAAVPPLRRVGRIAESHHGLKLLRSGVRGAYQTGLPAQQREPAGGVGKWLLVSFGAEFTDPMVLAAARGRNGGHLGHREHDEGHAEASDEKHPYRARRAAISEREDAGRESPLPSTSESAMVSSASGVRDCSRSVLRRTVCPKKTHPRMTAYPQIEKNRKCL